MKCQVGDFVSIWWKTEHLTGVKGTKAQRYGRVVRLNKQSITILVYDKFWRNTDYHAYIEKEEIMNIRVINKESE